MPDKDNLNPLIHQRVTPRTRLKTTNELDNDVRDPFDQREIFDLIRDINDPEHPLTLEDLRVVTEKDITVNDEEGSITVLFTPTIPHCSMATLIGLAIRVRLLRALPPRFKVEVEIAPGSHNSEKAVNKQLADKERVAAALENQHLLNVVNQCLTIKSNNYSPAA
ncbi:MIP18 family protein galla-2-like [Clavelina lepadiformis]|uniref:MIP18 family-like domain-containing protein n=1 Tax=Clavelina lepadiformis TaxID=159417 RepID=A0ABP0G0H4_CLALP